MVGVTWRALDDRRGLLAEVEKQVGHEQIAADSRTSGNCGEYICCRKLAVIPRVCGRRASGERCGVGDEGRSGSTG
jgi:hypothetical protein